MTTPLRTIAPRNSYQELPPVPAVQAKTKVRFRDLNFFYGRAQALHHISLEVPERIVMAFIGPSGCEKLTQDYIIGRFGCAMLAMAERDSQLAYSVLDQDDAIDQIEVYIDRQCIEIFALLQPAARDLRLVISVVKIAPLLERIADHACNIAQAKSLP